MSAALGSPHDSRPRPSSERGCLLGSKASRLGRRARRALARMFAAIGEPAVAGATGSDGGGGADAVASSGADVSRAPRAALGGAAALRRRQVAWRCRSPRTRRGCRGLGLVRYRLDGSAPDLADFVRDAARRARRAPWVTLRVRAGAGRGARAGTTCSGRHARRASRSALRRMKVQLDPGGLLNPGRSWSLARGWRPLQAPQYNPRLDIARRSVKVRPLRSLH